MELETFFTTDTQLEVFLISCVVGVVLGAIYDIFRIFRIVFPHNDILTALEDIILISGYGIFLMCFAFSVMRGQIRFFFVLGNILGFLIWFFSVGSIINRVALRMKKYILTLARWLAFPFKKIYTLAKKNLKNLKKHLIDSPHL